MLQEMMTNLGWLLGTVASRALSPGAIVAALIGFTPMRFRYLALSILIYAALHELIFMETIKSNLARLDLSLDLYSFWKSYYCSLLGFSIVALLARGVSSLFRGSREDLSAEVRAPDNQSRRDPHLSDAYRAAPETYSPWPAPPTPKISAPQAPANLSTGEAPAPTGSPTAQAFHDDPMIRELQRVPQRRLILNISMFACYGVIAAGVYFIISGLLSGDDVRLGYVEQLNLGIVILAVGVALAFVLRNATYAGMAITREAQHLVRQRFGEPENISVEFCIEDLRSRLDQRVRARHPNELDYIDPQEMLDKTIVELEVRYSLYVKNYGFKKEKFSEIITLCIMLNYVVGELYASTIFKMLQEIRERNSAFFLNINNRPVIPLFNGSLSDPSKVDDRAQAEIISLRADALAMIEHLKATARER